MFNGVKYAVSRVDYTESICNSLRGINVYLHFICMCIVHNYAYNFRTCECFVGSLLGVVMFQKVPYGIIDILTYQESLVKSFGQFE
jgi:hypothetical protein